MNRYYIPMVAMAFALLVGISGANAWSLDDLRVIIPQNSLSTVHYADTPYSNSFTVSTAGITFNSCRDPYYYQIGSCNYLHRCFIITPETCSE